MEEMKCHDCGKLIQENKTPGTCPYIFHFASDLTRPVRHCTVCFEYLKYLNKRATIPAKLGKQFDDHKHNSDGSIMGYHTLRYVLCVSCDRMIKVE